MEDGVHQEEQFAEESAAYCSTSSFGISGILNEVSGGPGRFASSCDKDTLSHKLPSRLQVRTSPNSSTLKPALPTMQETKKKGGGEGDKRGEQPAGERGKTRNQNSSTYCIHCTCVWIVLRRHWTDACAMVCVAQSICN